jgi:hypothetical protein
LKRKINLTKGQLKEWELKLEQKINWKKLHITNYDWSIKLKFFFTKESRTKMKNQMNKDKS